MEQAIDPSCRVTKSAKRFRVTRPCKEPFEDELGLMYLLEQLARAWVPEPRSRWWLVSDHVRGAAILTGLSRASLYGQARTAGKGAQRSDRTVPGRNRRDAATRLGRARPMTDVQASKMRMMLAAGRCRLARKQEQDAERTKLENAEATLAEYVKQHGPLTHESPPGILTVARLVAFHRKTIDLPWRDVRRQREIWTAVLGSDRH
jgi:hypothetical protein